MELSWNERPFWRCGMVHGNGDIVRQHKEEAQRRDFGGEDSILKEGVWGAVVMAVVEDIVRQRKEEEEARRRVFEDIVRQHKEKQARRRVFGGFNWWFLGYEARMEEAAQRLREAEEKRKEISVLIQRLSPAVNQTRKKKRDEMLQRILEAKSLDDIINELNWIEKRLITHRQQGHIHVQQERSGFFISLILLLPLASAQCSTCLGGRCYDTGQCILGCVPGYMNLYCDKVCPSNCLNNACELNTTSATTTCSDGCKAGYCGTKCTHHCPEGCVTCDRQCGSCNKTPCPERRYGEGCRSVCSPTYAKCDRETGQCIKCRKGYSGDNCDKKCEKCYSRGRNLIYKCLSGCEVCKEQDSCPDGLFGTNCELKCSENCGTSQETAGHQCNRATGECSAGCVSGYHGLNCNYTCSEHCLSGRCNRATGECSDGCVSGYHGLNCNYTCCEHCLSGRCNRATEECSAGCMPGYHGLTCNYTCNGLCENGLCNQHNGACALGCVSGYTQTSKSCEMLQDRGDKGAPVSITLIILIICVVSIHIVTWVVLVYVRTLIRRNKEYLETRYADKKERECLSRYPSGHSEI